MSKFFFKKLYDSFFKVAIIDSHILKSQHVLEYAKSLPGKKGKFILRFLIDKNICEKTVRNMIKEFSNLNYDDVIMALKTGSKNYWGPIYWDFLHLLATYSSFNPEFKYGENIFRLYSTGLVCDICMVNYNAEIKEIVEPDPAKAAHMLHQSVDKRIAGEQNRKYIERNYLDYFKNIYKNG